MVTIKDVYEITKRDIEKYYPSYNGGATEVDLKNPMILSGMGDFQVNTILITDSTCEIEPVLMPVK